jgi:hypothetical protein
LREGAAPTDGTAAAVAALAREIALNRGKVTDSALAAATQAGLSTEAVLDVLLVSRVRSCFTVRWAGQLEYVVSFCSCAA